MTSIIPIALLSSGSLYFILTASKLISQDRDNPGEQQRKRLGRGRMFTALGFNIGGIAAAYMILMVVVAGILSIQTGNREIMGYSGNNMVSMPSMWDVMMSDQSFVFTVVTVLLITLYLTGFTYFSYQAFRKYHQAIQLREMAHCREPAGEYCLAEDGHSTVSSTQPHPLIAADRQLYCKGCGSKIQTTDRFCYACGAPLC